MDKRPEQYGWQTNPPTYRAELFGEHLTEAEWDGHLMLSQTVRGAEVVIILDPDQAVKLAELLKAL